MLGGVGADTWRHRSGAGSGGEERGVRDGNGRRGRKRATKKMNTKGRSTRMGGKGGRVRRFVGEREERRMMVERREDVGVNVGEGIGWNSYIRFCTGQGIKRHSRTEDGYRRLRNWVPNLPDRVPRLRMPN